jgi:hypothetical protein
VQDLTSNWYESLNAKKEFIEQIVEKRGWHWALTSFTVEVWNNAVTEQFV